MVFFKHEYSDKSDSVVCFTAINDGTEIGRCTLVMMGTCAEITELSFSGDYPFVVEGLIKTGFNLAANHNCYIGRCSIDEIGIFLDRMNFNKTNGVYENDIPSIMMGSCKTCHNNQ